MSMTGVVVKLSSAVPAKWVWVRTMSSASASANATTSPTKPSSLFLNTVYTRERISATAIYKDGLRIASCAPIEHDKGPPQKILGFTIRRGYHHKCFSVSFSSSSSSSTSDDHSSASPDDEDKGGLSGSGGVVADMGSANKGQDWYGNGVFQSHNQSHSPMQHHHQQQHDSSKLLTLPTILTLARVAAVPFLIGTFYVDSWWGTTATTSIFIAAAITDWLDGYIARKMRLGSAFGAFLDPVADKLMVAATLVLLCTKPLDVEVFGQVPWLLPVPAIVIIGREITMSAVREWAASQNGKLSEAVAVNNLGKWKTATQMTALIILLATRDSSLGGPGILAASGVGLLYISAGLAVWSLVVYMSKIWRVLLR